MSGWHDAVSRLACMLFFERVVLRHGERVPREGPVLFLGLHRNGAVDGFVYNTLLPGAVFLVSSQLRRSLGGSSPASKCAGQDAGEGPDAAGLARCAEVLKEGGRVFLFRGTSSLGPRHLPLRSGPSRLLHSQATGVRVTVVPLSILYDSPQRWRSSVEVVVAEPFEAGGSPEDLNTLRKKVADSLEDAAFEFDSERNQESLQSLAVLLCRDGTLPYSEALRSLTLGFTAEDLSRWDSLRAEASSRGVLFYKGAPAWENPSSASRLRLALLALPSALAAALNLPPLLAGAWAGRRFPDGPNVVALWKILIGVPAFAAWALLLAAAALIAGRADLFILYSLATAAGLQCFAPAHKSAAAFWNALFHRSLMERVEDFRMDLFQSGAARSEAP